MTKIKDAVRAYKSLNGIVCVYKPPTVPIRQVQHAIITNLCKSLNSLPCRPIEKRVEIVGPTNEKMNVQLVQNYADNPLVCGPRYIHEDFRTSYSTHLGLFSSGVLLIGINNGTRLTHALHTARPTRAYKIHGQLGKATDTYFWNGRTMEQAMYTHVTRDSIDRVVAHMQAAHQKTMFEISGVHMESQTAYELAAQGPIRPANNKLPVIYGIKCVHFKPPDFTLEVQAVNEYDKYLWTLVHDLGVQLKTAAYCTGVQCIRQGKFTINEALLRKHWQLEFILQNMNRCQQILDENSQLTQPSARLMI